MKINRVQIHERNVLFRFCITPKCWALIFPHQQNAIKRTKSCSQINVIFHLCVPRVDACTSVVVYFLFIFTPITFGSYSRCSPFFYDVSIITECRETDVRHVQHFFHHKHPIAENVHAHAQLIVWNVDTVCCDSIVITVRPTKYEPNNNEQHMTGKLTKLVTRPRVI